MPAIQKDLGFDAAMIGIILSAFFWCYTLMQVPIGWICDRFGPGRVIVISGIFWGIFQMITGAISSSIGFIIVRVLLGIAESPMYPGASKLQSVWLTAAERGRGAAMTDAGSAMGVALGGPIVLAFMAWFGGWRGALVGAGVLTIIVVLLCRNFVIKTPDTHPLVNDAEREYLRKALTIEYESTQGEDQTEVGLNNYLRSASFWGMCMGFWGQDSYWYGLMTWSPMYLSSTQHLNIMGVSGAVFLIFGCGVLGEVCCGLLTDRLRQRGSKPNTVVHSTMFVAGVMSAVAMYLLAHATTVPTAITFLCTAMFFTKVAAALFWGMPAAISQRKDVGKVAGIMNFIGNVGGICTPIIIGVIVQATGGSYFWALLMFIIFALAFGVCPLLVDVENKVGSRRG
jgi:ACS family D-galactonate transporter-like MFS transporter